MRTYGTIVLEKDQWKIRAEPHVMMKLKAVCGKLVKHSHNGEVLLSNTPENCHDMVWFLSRYPMDVVDREILENGARLHRDIIERCENLVGGNYTPRHFKLAKPARDYQARAAEVLLSRWQLIVGDDQGLGKSLIAIAAMTDPLLPPVIRIAHTIDSDSRELHKIKDSAGELARIILGRIRSSKEQRFNAGGQFDMLMRQATGISKAPYVADFVRMIVESGEKVIVAGWHREVYALWESRLKDLKPLYYTGTESPNQKENNKQAFLRGDSPVLFMSLRAGVGVEGFQDVCSTVVFGEGDRPIAPRQRRRPGHRLLPDCRGRVRPDRGGRARDQEGAGRGDSQPGCAVDRAAGPRREQHPPSGGIIPGEGGGMNFCGIPVVIDKTLGELITRTRRWKRRGRLPKVRTRVVGRKPAIYWVDSQALGRTMIVVNPEATTLLQKKEPRVKGQLHDWWLEGQVRGLQAMSGLCGPGALLR